MKVSSLNQSVTVEKRDNIKSQIQPKNNETKSTYVINNSLIITTKKSSVPAVCLNPRQIEKNNEIDKNLDSTAKVITSASAVGTAITVPGEIINNAMDIKRICTSTMAGSLINATISTPNSLNEKAFLTVARTASKAIRTTDALTNIAVRYNNTKAYNVLSKKVLPTANAVVSGITIYTNVKKFDKSMKEGNKVEMLKSGTQIVLNGVSGVTGFIPGKGQIISSVTGVASIFTDFAIDKTSKMLGKSK